MSMVRTSTARPEVARIQTIAVTTMPWNGSGTGVSRFPRRHTTRLRKITAHQPQEPITNKVAPT